MLKTVTVASRHLAREHEDLAVARVVEVDRRPRARRRRQSQRRDERADHRESPHGFTLQALPLQSTSLLQLRRQVRLDRGVGGIAGDVVELVRVDGPVVELLLAGLGPDDVGVAVGAHAGVGPVPAR